MQKFLEKIEKQTGLPILTMEKAINLLKSINFDEKMKFIEVEVLGEITVAQIRALLDLPFEIALTEKDEKVILTTGDENSAGYLGPGSEYRQRRDNSRLSFHTHPIKEGEPVVNTPSFQDIRLLDFAMSDVPLLLAHRDGIILYVPPKINPITGKVPDEAAKYTAMEFCFAKGYDVFNIKSPEMKDKKSLADMTLDEQLSLAREFAEKSGMIIMEAAWDKAEDQESLAELMKYINLQH